MALIAALSLSKSHIDLTLNLKNRLQWQLKKVKLMS